jgi:DNA-binding transcriptional regulator YdaS (Cro superfamily)
MASESAPNRPLRAAIEILGSQSALAELVGVRQPAVSKWLAKGAPLPAEFVLRVESETGISRHELRPDVYPPDMPPAPPLHAGIEATQ